MVPYIVILLVLFLLSTFSFSLKDKFKLISFACICILILFSGLRQNVGMDYESYKYLYEGGGEIKESGFAFIVNTFKFIGFPFEVFVFVMSTVTLGFAYVYILRYSPYTYLSLLIFYSFGTYYFTTFNAMRQVVVVYVFFYSLKYIEEKSFFKYIISILLCAYFFHTTAILLLPLYFILQYNYSKFLKLIILVTLLSTSNLLIVIIENSRYAMYLDFEKFISDVSLVTYLTLLISLIMVVGRISYYFTPVLIVLIPMSIDRLTITNNKKIILVVVSIVLYALCFISLYFNGVSNKLVPFTTIFN